MVWKTIYATAVAAAFAAFAMAGGIRASEKAAVAVERQEDAHKPAKAAVPPGKDATLPFANSGNIRDWRPDGTNALYVQDRHGQWYHAALMGTCIDLTTTDSIAFLTQGPDQLDQYSAISVRGQRCPFAAFVTSDAPPRKGAAKAAVTKG